MKAIARAKCLFEEADYAEVRAMLALLPDPEFRIIYLRYWATYTIAQISQELRMSWDAVDRRLSHALLTLRSMYGLKVKLPEAIATAA